MVNIKVLNGTPRDGESLCRTCRYVHLQKGYRDSEEMIYCDWSQTKRILFNVRECTDYTDRTVPSKYDMEKIAWILEIKGGRAMGFTPPKPEVLD